MPQQLARRHNVTVTGNGPVTLLFLHGLGCDQSMWRFVAPAFASHARVVLMDLAGCGGSDVSAWDPVRYERLDGHALDVIEVAQQFAGERSVLVGHSVGAMIGMLADLRAPWLFDAHAMIAPSPCYRNEPGYAGGFEPSALETLVALVERDVSAWADFMAPHAMGQGQPPALASDLAAAFCRAHPPALAQFARATFLSDLRPQLAELLKPVLLLQCTDDPVAPPAVGRYMEQHLMDCTVRMVRNEGHCPQVSSPGACIAALSHFIASLGLGFDRPQETDLGDLQDTGWDAAAR
ncbi:MAG TPA: alpha/beta hydrolase [Ramlibacter sp.]|uniref:alpha/beta fold hydrolase n=1 Tax=Ramlibacter sp. TaxID=1917967 RepID=UPI002D591991|nr:alpha/beta hydrolase [Ramlibacter sp.]HZY19110.1 alpha/beta hydrolase [Ramlibacter sp.]